MVLVGTVTISNGVKTVTNVTANGIPTTTFDPADFLTPADVLAVIADVESQGAKLAHVTYDEQWSFPAAVVIIRSTGIPMTDYRMSGFVDLSAGNGSVNKSVETNRRPASPFNIGRKFESASCAPPSLSAAVAHP